MGTRGLFGVKIDGNDKVTYNHFDSYPDALGKNMVIEFLEYLDEPGGYELLKKQARELVLVSEDTEPTDEQISKLSRFANVNVSSGDLKDWYCLLRGNQGRLRSTLQSGFMIDSRIFAFDSLFCEYGYIINLDEEVFECYLGFQKQPHEMGRFATDPEAKELISGGYYPIALILAVPFSCIRERFIESGVKLLPDRKDD